MRHHAAGLARLQRSDELSRILLDDFRQAPLSPTDRSMLEYADKLTRTPWLVGEDDIRALRTASFTDIAILQINLTASYYAYVNRIALGLGVQLEEFWDE